jgi:photosystem II stability/assembly factor-like uncharacterized protein
MRTSGYRRTPAPLSGAKGVRRAVLTAVAALVAAAVPVNASAAVNRCAVARFSPAFAQDRTVLCLTGDGHGDAALRTSHDAGQTWSAPHALGRGVWGIDLVLSPGFATDHTLWVVTENGVAVSRNAGATFAVLDATAVAHPPVTAAYVDANGPVLLSLTAANAMPPAGREFRRVAGQDVTTQVVGAPDAYIEAVLNPGADVTRVVASSFVAQQSDPTGLLTDGVTVRECRAALACGPATFHAGDGQELVDVGTVAGDAYLVTASYKSKDIRVFRGRDAGTGWTRWPSLEQRLAPLVHLGADVPGIVLPHLLVTAAPDHPGRLFALVENTLGIMQRPFTKVAAAERRPAYELLRSDDDGAHWSRVAVSYGPLQRGVSRLPWNDRAVRPLLVAEPGNRLYVVAAHDRPGGYVTDYAGLFSSADNGAHWRRAIA